MNKDNNITDYIKELKKLELTDYCFINPTIINYNKLNDFSLSSSIIAYNDLIELIKKTNGNNNIITNLCKFVKHNINWDENEKKLICECYQIKEHIIEKTIELFKKNIKCGNENIEYMKTIYKNILDKMKKNDFTEICYCLDLRYLIKNINFKHSNCNYNCNDYEKNANNNCYRCIYLSILDLIRYYKVKFIIFELYKFNGNNKNCDYNLSTMWSNIIKEFQNCINIAFFNNCNDSCLIEKLIYNKIKPLLSKFVAAYYYLITLFIRLVYTIYYEYYYTDNSNNYFKFLESFQIYISKTFNNLNSILDCLFATSNDLRYKFLDIFSPQKTEYKEKFFSFAEYSNNNFKELRSLLLSKQFKEIIAEELKKY